MFVQRLGKYLQLVAVLGAAPLSVAQTTVTGVLAKSDTGRPISHAVIHAAASTSAKGGQIFRTETAWDGSFIFADLPLGTFRFCVHNLDNYLNPCEWPTTNAAQPMQISTSDPKLKLKVDPGRRVHLRVNDSAGLLSGNLASGRKPEVVVMIVDKSGKIWRRVPALGAGTAGHFSLLVPNDPSYGFALASAEVNLSDSSGIAIPRLAFVPFADPLTSEARALLMQQWHVSPEDPAVVVSVSGLKP